MQPRLRIFRGDEPLPEADVPEAKIRLEQLLRILEDGLKWQRSWLQDFADDEIRISADLHDIISAYSDMRPSA